MIIVIACNKDKMNVEEQCVELETLVDMQGMPLFHQVYPSYGVPCFNPNNSEEIIFFYAKENTGPPHKLVKYNLNSKVYQTIYEGLFGIRPRWSKKGWIILSLWNELGNDGFNIWKIKENGDSLIQLTTNGNCFFPEWNKEGDKIIYELGNTSPTKFILANQSGEIIDTSVVGVGGGGSWQHDSLIINANFKGLFLGNPYSNFYDYELISSVENNSQSLGGAEWVNNLEVLWSHVTGVYLTDIINNKTKKLIETCNAKYYQLPTYSPQINKVIFQRIDRIKTDKNGGNLYTGLYIMNLDGTCEEKIEIIE